MIKREFSFDYWVSLEWFLVMDTFVALIPTNWCDVEFDSGVYEMGY